MSRCADRVLSSPSVKALMGLGLTKEQAEKVKAECKRARGLIAFREITGAPNPDLWLDSVRCHVVDRAETYAPTLGRKVVGYVAGSDQVRYFALPSGWGALME